MKKVLVVATSHLTRGGITSVVKAHQKGRQWTQYHCRWIETHRDKGILERTGYFIRAMIEYIFLLPFYDLVHIHLSEPPSALRKLPFMWYAKLWRKNTIVHFHSFSVETTIHSKYQWLYRYLFTKTDRVVVLSEYWKQQVEQTFTSAKVQIIYNPCTAETSDSIEHIIEARKAEPVKSILYAGTVGKRKGYEDMIVAFSKVAKDHPDWKIVFAGNGEIENGKLLASNLGISSQVEWLGWVNGPAKDDAFRKTTVFCLPSYAEGFPMSVLDAWAYGLPVITTPVGGIPDVAIDGKNMLLFNPGDIDSLAACMQRMMDDGALRDSIAQESVKLATTTFNIETIDQKVGDLYKSLLKE